MDECCATCPDGVKVCRDGDWPPSACKHGLAACEFCVRQVCPKCADELGVAA